MKRRRELGLPAWAEEMRQVFKAGATSQFVLHGNVFDLVPAPDGKGGADFVALGEFLTGTMFQPFDVVVRYDRGRGVRIEPPDPSRHGRLQGRRGGVPLPERRRRLPRRARARSTRWPTRWRSSTCATSSRATPSARSRSSTASSRFARRRTKVQDGKVGGEPAQGGGDPRLRALHRPAGRPDLRRRPEPDTDPDPGVGREPRGDELLRRDRADHREPRRPQPEPRRVAVQREDPGAAAGRRRHPRVRARAACPTWTSSRRPPR